MFHKSSIKIQCGEIKNIKQVKVQDKVYRIVSNSLNKKQWENHKKEIKKIDISCKIYQNRRKYMSGAIQ